MSRIRTLGLTALATAALLGGMLFLFPANAAAATVEFNEASIGEFDPTNMAINFYVSVPAGEHIPLDEVLIHFAAAGTSDGPDGIMPADCIYRTSTFTATGASKTADNFHGYGYTVGASTAIDFDGYGYGYGYGYSGGTSGVTLIITVSVPKASITCLGTHLMTNPAELYGTFKVQARIGPIGIDEIKLRSAIATPTIVNPDFVTGPPSTNPAEFSSQVKPYTLGDKITATYSFSTVNGGTFTGTKSIPFAALGSFMDEGQFNFGSKTVPSGARVNIVTNEAATNDNPGFGIRAAELDAKIKILNGGSTKAVALSFQVTGSSPGLGTVNPDQIVDSIDLKFKVPLSYFTSTGTTPWDFKVIAFHDNGDPKTDTEAPQMQGFGESATHVTFTYKMSSFSAVVGVGGAPAASGGSCPNCGIPPVTDGGAATDGGTSTGGGTIGTPDGSDKGSGLESSVGEESETGGENSLETPEKKSKKWIPSLGVPAIGGILLAGILVLRRKFE